MTLVTYHSDPARPGATLLVPSPEQLPESGDHWCGQPGQPLEAGRVTFCHQSDDTLRTLQVNTRRRPLYIEKKGFVSQIKIG